MNKAKALSVKNMKEAIINLSKNPEDFYNIFEAFMKMADMGFIHEKVWKKFYEQCSCWYMTQDCSAVIDDDVGKDEVVWVYNAETEYRA